MTNALTIYQPKTMKELQEVGAMMVASDYFPNVERISQASVKIMMGAELGFNAIASMKSIHIIDGKPTIGGDLLAAKIQASSKYRYTIQKHTSKGCSIEFFERIDEKWESVGISSFDEKDAQQAGLLSRHNWKKYPRNMYFNRAIANGQRWFAPDVFDSSGTVYTPDELGAEVDENDNIVNGVVIEDTPVPEVSPAADPPTPDPLQQEAQKLGGKVKFPNGFLTTLTNKVAKEFGIDSTVALVGIEKHIADGNITPGMNHTMAMNFLKEQAASKKAQASSGTQD